MSMLHAETNYLQSKALEVLVGRLDGAAVARSGEQERCGRCLTYLL